MRGEQVKKSCVEEQLKSILFGARLHHVDVQEQGEASQGGESDEERS